MYVLVFEVVIVVEFTPSPSFCPAVPANVMYACCPTRGTATVTDGPLIAICPALITSDSVYVTLPVPSEK